MVYGPLHDPRHKGDSRKVWVDANSDGVSETGEMVDLQSLGIIEINLTSQTGTEVNHGNVVGLVSDYKTSDGATHAMADVWFTKSTTSTEHGVADTGTATTGTGGDIKHLTVSASDLLADRGHDLLAGQPSAPTKPEVQATPAVENLDVHLVKLDPTQLVDDKQNNPLI